MDYEYPAYFKATDPDGNAIALIANEDPSTITIVDYNPAQGKVSFARVGTIDDVKSRIGGQLVSVSPEEYEKILFDDWNFSLSQVVFGATSQIEEGLEDASTEDGLAEAAGLSSDVEGADGTEHGDDAPDSDISPAESQLDTPGHDETSSDGGESIVEGTGSEDGTAEQADGTEQADVSGCGDAPDDAPERAA